MTTKASGSSLRVLFIQPQRCRHDPARVKLGGLSGLAIKLCFRSVFSADDFVFFVRKRPNISCRAGNRELSYS